MKKACPHCGSPNLYTPQLAETKVKCIECRETFTMRFARESTNSPSGSPASENSGLQASRSHAALQGLFGTVAASFLPGFLLAVIATLAGGESFGGKLGVGGTIAVCAYILVIFTVVTVAAYLVGLLPLLLVARARRPSHAFWLAASASLLTLPAIATFNPVIVFFWHLTAFSIACVLYHNYKPKPDGVLTREVES